MEIWFRGSGSVGFCWVLLGSVGFLSVSRSGSVGFLAVSRSGSVGFLAVSLPSSVEFLLVRFCWVLTGPVLLGSYWSGSVGFLALRWSGS